MAAYTYFVKLIRDEHRKKHPDEHFDFAEFSAKCAEKWKSMKPEERKRFEELAAEDNEKKLSGSNRKRKSRKRQKKAPGQPKRAWSAFFYFCDERRPRVRKDHPEWRVAEVARELGRLWEACSNRDKYEKMAVLDKERYEKEMDQFRAGNFIAGETKRPKLCDQVGHEEEEEEEDGEEEEEDAEGSSAAGMVTADGDCSTSAMTTSHTGSVVQDTIITTTTSLANNTNNTSTSIIATSNPQYSTLINDTSNPQVAMAQQQQQQAMQLQSSSTLVVSPPDPLQQTMTVTAHPGAMYDTNTTTQAPTNNGSDPNMINTIADTNSHI